MVELLAPAGSIESLKAAVHAGADAVYIGGNRFGARAYADNPDENVLIEGIHYCHLHGKKIYMTVNTLLKESELTAELYGYLKPYYEAGLDGVIVQDIGVVTFIRYYFPDMEVHSSTQMTITSPEGAKLMKSNGITRVVPARELSLEEIKEIIRQTGLEVETFIHGAMCYCYSGQCLMSSMIGGRSGNRGRCAQPCRLPYRLENGKKGYFLSMKDMCSLSLLPDIIDAGIASLKIEGRMKRPEYTAGVVAIYRKYIDLYYKKGRKGFQIAPQDMSDLMDLYNRGGFSKGYYHQRNGKSMMAMERPNHNGTEAAIVKRAVKGKVELTALETLNKKDILEIEPSNEITLQEDVAKGKNFTIKLSRFALKPNDIIRRTRNEALLEDIRKKYIENEYQEKIKGDLRIFRDFPAILKITYGDVQIEVTGEIAQPAINRDTDENTVRRQMQKTGATAFVFEKLDIHMEPGLFIPMGGLNELRRKALDRLQDEVVSLCSREVETELYADPKAFNMKHTSEKENDNIDPKDEKQNSPLLSVLVSTEEQLDVILNTDFIPLHSIYLDSMIFGMVENLADHFEIMKHKVEKIKKKSILCYFYMPPVFRKEDRDYMEHPLIQTVLKQMDGVQVHTADQLQYILDLPFNLEITGENSLYAYNNHAAAFWHEQGVSRMNLPCELNLKELMMLDKNHGKTELTVYGHQPVMQSVQCVRRNTNGCTRKPGLMTILDRKNIEFPVLNRCATCCNTIYNSVPLDLLGCQTDVQRLLPDFLRLNFTIETQDTMKKILKRFQKAFIRNVSESADENEGTRGHFRRGVE